MAKPTELKIAADIIRRVLDAAERGDMAYLDQVRQAARRRPSDNRHNADKQEVIEYGRFGSKFTEKDIIEEIEKFDEMTALAEHLRKKYVTRTDIDAVAKAVHIPATKNLDYEAVVSRIVDVTLGYKIRSKAVRGEPVDRKNKD